MSKPTIKQRKALRRAAALKGWETRRALAEATERWAAKSRLPGGLNFTLLDEPAPPDPTPATPNWLHRLWAKLTGAA